MTDDELRDLIASLPPNAIQVRDGFVAIARGKFENEGADIDEVKAFVEKEGGALRQAPPYQLRETSSTSGFQPGIEYFEIPEHLRRGSR